jgi:hypothetical protein
MPVRRTDRDLGPETLLCFGEANGWCSAWAGTHERTKNTTRTLPLRKW